MAEKMRVSSYTYIDGYCHCKRLTHNMDTQGYEFYIGKFEYLSLFVLFIPNTAVWWRRGQEEWKMEGSYFVAWYLIESTSCVPVNNNLLVIWIADIVWDLSQ